VIDLRYIVQDWLYVSLLVLCMYCNHKGCFVCQLSFTSDLTGARWYCQTRKRYGYCDWTTPYWHKNWRGVPANSSLCAKDWTWGELDLWWWFEWCYTWMCVHLCVCPLLQVIYNMNFTSENARNSCMCTQNIFFILTGNSVERSIICVALYFSAFESPHHGLAL